MVDRVALDQIKTCLMVLVDIETLYEVLENDRSKIVFSSNYAPSLKSSIIAEVHHK